MMIIMAAKVHQDYVVRAISGQVLFLLSSRKKFLCSGKLIQAQKTGRLKFLESYVVMD